MNIRKQVRNLIYQYEVDKTELRKDFERELKRLQSLCEHPELSTWEFRTNRYGDIYISKNDIPIRFRDCEYCGKTFSEEAVESVLDEIPWTFIE